MLIVEWGMPFSAKVIIYCTGWIFNNFSVMVQNYGTVSIYSIDYEKYYSIIPYYMPLINKLG